MIDGKRAGLGWPTLHFRGVPCSALHRLQPRDREDWPDTNLSQQAVREESCSLRMDCAFVFAAVLTAVGGALWLVVDQAVPAVLSCKDSKFWPPEIHKQAHN